MKAPALDHRKVAKEFEAAAFGKAHERAKREGLPLGSHVLDVTETLLVAILHAVLALPVEREAEPPVDDEPPEGPG